MSERPREQGQGPPGGRMPSGWHRASAACHLPDAARRCSVPVPGLVPSPASFRPRPRSVPGSVSSPAPFRPRLRFVSGPVPSPAPFRLRLLGGRLTVLGGCQHDICIQDYVNPSLPCAVPRCHSTAGAKPVRPPMMDHALAVPRPSRQRRSRREKRTVFREGAKNTPSKKTILSHRPSTRIFGTALSTVRCSARTHGVAQAVRAASLRPLESR